MVVYMLEQCWTKWACDRFTDDAVFGKKNHLLRWSSFWSWLVCKQAKLSHLGHRKPACIHWKAEAPKMSHCLERILVQRHNWAIFLRKWASRGHYSQSDHYRAMLHEFLFTKIEKKDIGNIWFQQDGATCHTAEATLDVLRPIFEDRIISRRANVVWPPVLRRHVRDNWRFKGQYSWSHWWNTAARNR